MAGVGGPVYVTTTTGNCSWSGWLGVTAAALTLSVTATLQVTGGGGSTYNTLAYSLDGVNFTTFFSSTVALVSTIYTAPVPAGTNLEKVIVQAQSHSSVPAISQRSEYATINVSNIKIS
jgi:hypothetical protein